MVFFGILSGGRRHWAAALKSGHAVQRKRCGSLNRSFSYWEAARSRRPFREASPGTSQATGGSLQVLIGGVPVPSRIQLFQRNGVAKMEWVPRRPLGRAFSSKILGMKVKSWKQHSPKSPRGVPDGPTSPTTWSSRRPRCGNIAPNNPKIGEHGPQHNPRWANIAPRRANIEVPAHFCHARPRQPTSLATGGSVSRVNSQHDPKTIQMDLMMGRFLDKIWKIIVLDPSLPISCPGMAGAGRSPYNNYETCIYIYIYCIYLIS